MHMCSYLSCVNLPAEFEYWLGLVKKKITQNYFFGLTGRDLYMDN